MINSLKVTIHFECIGETLLLYRHYVVVKKLRWGQRRQQPWQLPSKLKVYVEHLESYFDDLMWRRMRHHIRTDSLDWPFFKNWCLVSRLLEKWLELITSDWLWWWSWEEGSRHTICVHQEKDQEEKLITWDEKHQVITGGERSTCSEGDVHPLRLRL